MLYYIIVFVYSFKNISLDQNGYMLKRSTITNLTLSMFSERLDQRGEVDVFAKIFDHSYLLKKLIEFGFHNYAVFFKSYSIHRNQFVT